MSFSHLNATDSKDNNYVIQYQRPTFLATKTNAAIGNNKSMFSIMNTSTSVVRIERVYIINNQTTAITGVVSSFELRRITSHSAGTLITSEKFDSQDTLDAGVTVRTGATVAGEGNLLNLFKFSSDEWGVGAQDVETLQNIMQVYNPAFQSAPYMKPHTLRQNQGIHIKHTVNSTIGNFDFIVEFTVDTE